MSDHTTQEYRESLSAPDTDDMFTLAYQWQDKPHRHVFDLCNWVDRLERKLAIYEKALRSIEELKCEEGQEDENIYMLIGEAIGYTKAATIARRAREEVEGVR